MLPFAAGSSLVAGKIVGLSTKLEENAIKPKIERAMKTYFTTQNKAKGLMDTKTSVSNEQILEMLKGNKSNVFIIRGANDVGKIKTGHPLKDFFVREVLKTYSLRLGSAKGAGVIKLFGNSYILAPGSASKTIFQHEVGHLLDKNLKLRVFPKWQGPSGRKEIFNSEIRAWKLGLTREERIAARPLIRHALSSYKKNLRGLHPGIKRLPALSTIPVMYLLYKKIKEKAIKDAKKGS